ncbi:2-oxoglutarate dehydrogenase complex dihydrolipoyllysine-residue succinyltransferase [Teredinibacter turnerae]|uniref:2-oxoglutarate dehydrogenase complex dihydrolipoyllysine-residue succinyltransferase n=1 Tax=Teredinibacter turnerae TaxID=2426 RepID=UPI0003786DA1|nr:2-oxoglutarate dehydrogenase complex dihydrolipoyllysine-residue succinyltransferase [Teredinibacter turnerae]
MSNEIKVPTFPESVQEGTIATWHKQPGEAFARDEIIVDIETDKVVQEVPAPAAGVMKEILKGEGDTVTSNEVIALFNEGEAAADSSEPAAPAAAEPASTGGSESDDSADVVAAPAAKKLAQEKGIDLAKVKGTGKGGRITKEDVAAYKDEPAAAPAPAQAAKPAPAAAKASAPAVSVEGSGERVEKRVPMTRLRARIAERLLDATQTTAMLTTFNEVNMEPIMKLRSQYKDKFEKVHNGTRLGFMGFFVKAAVEALRRIPAVNASIDGNDVVYHGYQDIGVAVSTPKGLVVPVLRNTENMSLAAIENGIRDFGLRARDGKIGIEEMQGGTFTITNGGVFGSLLSTPILNPPQAAILGMHKIQERPMAVNGEVKILPMMYLALSYDHRLIDGKEAVSFLVAIKEMIEDPARILLEI